MENVKDLEILRALSTIKQGICILSNLELDNTYFTYRKMISETSEELKDLIDSVNGSYHMQKDEVD